VPSEAEILMVGQRLVKDVNRLGSLFVVIRPDEILWVRRFHNSRRSKWTVTVVRSHDLTRFGLLLISAYEVLLVRSRSQLGIEYQRC
jgi:hypothetical protein